MIKIILIILMIFLIFKCIIYPLCLEKHSNKFEIYVGIPGTGKTTIAAWFSRKYQKKGKPVWSNVDIKGNYILNAREELGNYEIKDGLVIIDEAGLEFDNRAFTSYPKNCNFFFKYHRHYNCDIKILSQDLDVDLKMRRLASKYYLLKKSFIPYFIARREIQKDIDIKEGDIVETHKFPLIGGKIPKLFFAPKAWKMFNTTERPKLLEKDFEKWDTIHFKEKES